jgi:hypothetical protein
VVLPIALSARARWRTTPGGPRGFSPSRSGAHRRRSRSGRLGHPHRAALHHANSWTFSSSASYLLVVIDRTGRVQQAAGWRVVPGTVSNVIACPDLCHADIARPEVRTSSGQPVLRSDQPVTAAASHSAVIRLAVQ